VGRLKLAAAAQSVPEPSAAGLPDCPSYLHGQARAAWHLWKTELEVMGLDAACDAPTLASACMNFQTVVTAHLKIQKEGAVIREPIVSRDTGLVMGHRVKKNPWVSVREHAHRLLLGFCSEFGISPAARTRLNVNVPKASAAETIDALLNGPMLTDEEKRHMQ